MRLSSVRIIRDGNNTRLLYNIMLFLLLNVFATHHRVSSFAIPARQAAARSQRTWEESFQYLKSYKETYGDCNVPRGYTQDKPLALWVMTQRMSKSKLNPERREALNAIGFDWEPHMTAWNEMFGRLKAYKEKHGDCNVPYRYTQDESLAAWVVVQRRKKSKLSPAQREALNEIGIDWEPHMTAWNEMFGRLKAYKEKHGDCNVPYRYTQDESLAAWVNTQRQRKSKSKLSDSQLHALTAIGFDWDPFETNWQEMFGKLKAYKEIHGDCNVSSNCTDTSLVYWVENQRKFRLKLPLHQENALEKIGFDWDPHETLWCEMYQKLVAYNQTYRDSRVPQKWRHDPALGHWVSSNRLSQKRNKLAPSREERLNAINFRWSVPREQNIREILLWDEGYKALVAFKAKYGHCLVSRTYHDKSLVSWVKYQRKNQVRLPQWRRELLDLLGFEYNPLEADWKEQFNGLKLYKKEHGNCNVPKIFPDDEQLGRWVARQRVDNLKKKLSTDRCAALDSIGFVWDPLEANWQNMFQQLEAYKQKHGHCNVPRKYPEDPALGGWVGRQRRFRNEIPVECQQRLESIGFDWDPNERNRLDKLVAHKNKNGNFVVTKSEL